VGAHAIACHLFCFSHSLYSSASQNGRRGCSWQSGRKAGKCAEGVGETLEVGDKFKNLQKKAAGRSTHHALAN
jgi:hypothetical protein